MFWDECFTSLKLCSQGVRLSQEHQAPTSPELSLALTAAFTGIFYFCSVSLFFSLFGSALQKY